MQCSRMVAQTGGGVGGGQAGPLQRREAQCGCCSRQEVFGDESFSEGFCLSDGASRFPTVPGPQMSVAK